MDGPQSDRSCCISKYLQLKGIDCDESVESKQPQKSSLAAFGKVTNDPRLLDLPKQDQLKVISDIYSTAVTR